MPHSLGDSGFVIIRSSSLLYKQQPQTHFFNCPKLVLILRNIVDPHKSNLRQLTKLPIKSRRRFSRACVDSPSEAETFRMVLRDGDIVIAYVFCSYSLAALPLHINSKTDGLSDNVFSSEIVTICALVARHGGSEDRQVQAIADRLVDYARQCMASKTRLSPFESRPPYCQSASSSEHLCETEEAARQGMFFRGGVRRNINIFCWID